MENNTTSSNFNYTETNTANYSTETLFTEMYRTMVKCMGNMARNDNSSTDRKLQGKYLWILINMSWATIRVNLGNEKIKEHDKIFESDISSLEDARNKIFKLLELGAEAGLLIKQDVGVSDYDNMYIRKGLMD